MLKPILDAMKGIVYTDDDLVMDVRGARRDIGETFRLDGASPALLHALGGGIDFVHLRIEDAPDPKDVL